MKLMNRLHQKGWISDPVSKAKWSCCPTRAFAAGKHCSTRTSGSKRRVVRDRVRAASVFDGPRGYREATHPAAVSAGTEGA